MITSVQVIMKAVIVGPELLIEVCSCTVKVCEEIQLEQQVQNMTKKDCEEAQDHDSDLSEIVRLCKSNK